MHTIRQATNLLAGVEQVALQMDTTSVRAIIVSRLSEVEIPRIVFGRGDVDIARGTRRDSI